MIDEYTKYAHLFKAMSDRNRVMIVDMISCGEICACKILERFDITQPTLSHHMKILCDSGLVIGRKDGKWTHYSLNVETALNFRSFLAKITTTKENCICEGSCEC